VSGRLARRMAPSPVIRKCTGYVAVLAIDAAYTVELRIRCTPHARGGPLLRRLLAVLGMEVLQLRSKRQARRPAKQVGISDAQQCSKFPGLSQQIVPSYSQNLAFANHVYRLDPLKQPPSGACASWSYPSWSYRKAGSLEL
jgi:hypothetical protein